MATRDEFKSLEYFSPDEFERPESMSYLLLCLLDSARAIAGIPFVVTSSVRGGSAEHSVGQAVDIRCHYSEDRYRILKAAFAAGFRRIGVYDRHVHLGVAETLDQDVLWTGESR